MKDHHGPVMWMRAICGSVVLMGPGGGLSYHLMLCGCLVCAVPGAVLVSVGLCSSWDPVDVGGVCYPPEAVVLSGAKSGSRDLLQPEAMLLSTV